MTRKALGSHPLSEPPPVTQLARAAQEAVRLWGSAAMLGWSGKADFRRAMVELRKVLAEMP